MNIKSGKFLKEFINLIKECNKIVLDVYDSDYSIIEKNDGSPLTIADINCNKHICNFLKNNYPEITIISEENKEIEYNKRKNVEYCWLIDPIDGTKEFLKKNGEFTINIGLCKNKIPIFGIVSIPCKNEIYYGIENIGSFKIDQNDDLTKLNIKKKNFKEKNLNIVASSSHINESTKKFIKQFEDPNIINVGSSIKLLWIAEGKADILRLGLTSEWDTYLSMLLLNMQVVM